MSATSSSGYVPANGRGLRRRSVGGALGVIVGVVLFVLVQGVALDRSGEDYSAVLTSLGVVVLVAVGISLFTQAALQDWRHHDRHTAGEQAEANGHANDETSPARQRRGGYWFTAGLTFAGVLVLSLTITGTRVMPQMLDPAPIAPGEQLEQDEQRKDVPYQAPRRRPEPARSPEEHPFYRGD